MVIEHITAYYLRIDEDPTGLIDEARRRWEVRAIDHDWEWILPRAIEHGH